MKVPSFDSMMNPLLEAMHQLGGSGHISEINEKTIQLLNLPDEIVDVPRSDNSSQSEIEYRLGWTRSYLKKYGVLENSRRGIWSLTKTANEPVKVDPREVVLNFKESKRNKNQRPGQAIESVSEDIDDNDNSKWEAELKKVLMTLEPSQFERLSQRILRESGFTQVEVTGRSGDGGIDGKGLIKIGGLVSFHAMFQCKRFQSTVSASHIRDFRGALQGRADRGIFITTGFFTRDATKEAQRDGAPPIDLIDGDDLVNKLKELSLGVKVEHIEKVTIDREWFAKI